MYNIRFCSLAARSPTADLQAFPPSAKSLPSVVRFMSGRVGSPSCTSSPRAKRPRFTSSASLTESPEGYDLGLNSLVRAVCAEPSRDPTGDKAHQRQKGRVKIPLGSGQTSLGTSKSPNTNGTCESAGSKGNLTRTVPPDSEALVRLTETDATTGEATFLLRPSGGRPVSLAGSVELEVLHGAVSVLAYTVTPVSGSVPLYSAPHSPFLLTLSAVDPGTHSRRAGNLTPAVQEAVLGVIPLSGSTGEKVLYAVLRMRPLSKQHSFSASAEIMSAQLPLPQVGCLGREKSVLVDGCAIADSGSRHFPFTLWNEWKCVTSSLEFWCRTSEHLPARVLVVGDGGTGKSMLARCVVNHLLMTNKTVMFVETDVGQPELTPPGLVSATEVQSPLLGPALSHNRTVPMFGCYFGEITPRDNVSLYAAAVANVVGAARSHASAHGIPLVCNSDGWVSGVGGELLQHVMDQLEPSHAFATALRSEAEQESPGSVPSSESDPEISSAVAMGECPEAVRSILEKFADEQRVVLLSPYTTKAPGYPAALLRDMGLMSYFAEAFRDGVTRCVSLEEVNVSIIGEGVQPSTVLAALNGSIVGLAVTGGADPERWNVQGLGLVRAIETETVTLHVCTPLDDAALEVCDGILVSSGVQAPAGLFYAMAAAAEQADDEEISAPYIVKGVLGTAEAMKSRSTLQRR